MRYLSHNNVYLVLEKFPYPIPSGSSIETFIDEQIKVASANKICRYKPDLTISYSKRAMGGEGVVKVKLPL